MWEFVLHMYGEIEEGYPENKVAHFSTISEEYSFHITQHKVFVGIENLAH